MGNDYGKLLDRGLQGPAIHAAAWLEATEDLSGQLARFASILRLPVMAALFFIS